jgi:hypothetical protein
MHALEFHSRFEEGRISVPSTVKLANGQAVRVLILLDEATEPPGADLAPATDIVERTSGAWQGEPLERVSQGEYERRLDLP